MKKNILFLILFSAFAFADNYSTVINFSGNFDQQSKSYSIKKSVSIACESFSYFTVLNLESETESTSIPEPALFIIYQLLFIIYWKKLVLRKN